jgi:hypothetical protein
MKYGHATLIFAVDRGKVSGGIFRHAAGGSNDILHVRFGQDAVLYGVQLPLFFFDDSFCGGAAAAYQKVKKTEFGGEQKREGQESDQNDNIVREIQLFLHHAKQADDNADAGDRNTEQGRDQKIGRSFGQSAAIDGVRVLDPFSAFVAEDQAFGQLITTG